MKRYLLDPQKKCYKANLHCHSSVSDGRLTPEELKAAYKSLGYSVVAYSEHDIMVQNHHLRDEDFLPLTAIEYDVANTNPERKLDEGDTCHFNFIALDESMDTQILWHREKYIPKTCMHSKHLAKFDENEPDYEREYTPECITDMMTRGRKANFFVTYNHPTWSQESYNEYINYDGMHAMEIINNISNTGTGVCEYNDRVYDDMLRAGKRIYCIGADDTHAKYPLGHRKCDIGGAYTVIFADKLEYKSITDALLAGSFYASEAPVINSVWYEDGKIFIDCEPTDRIIFTVYPRRGMAFFDEEGSGITHAEFEIPEESKFVRITLVDKSGKRAYTNAYFTDELRGEG